MAIFNHRAQRGATQGWHGGCVHTHDPGRRESLPGARPSLGRWPREPRSALSCCRRTRLPSARLRLRLRLSPRPAPGWLRAEGCDLAAAVKASSSFPYKHESSSWAPCQSLLPGQGQRQTHSGLRRRGQGNTASGLKEESLCENVFNFKIQQRNRKPHESVLSALPII